MTCVDSAPRKRLLSPRLIKKNDDKKKSNLKVGQREAGTNDPKEIKRTKEKSELVEEDEMNSTRRSAAALRKVRT